MLWEFENAISELTAVYDEVTHLVLVPKNCFECGRRGDNEMQHIISIWRR